MKSKKLSILLAAIMLIAAQLACAAGEPTFSNVRTARDADGAQPATTFSSLDTVYVVGDLANGVIGNNVTSIGDYAFYYCSSLTSISLPNSVTTLGDNAFGHCWSLTSIATPASAYQRLFCCG